MEAPWHDRRLAGFPADDLGHADGGDQFFRRLRQDRSGSDLLHRVDFLRVAARGQRDRGDTDEDAADHGATSATRRLSQPAASTSSAPMIDSTNPAPATAVHPSRAWTSELMNSTIQAISSSANASQAGLPRMASIKKL